MRLIDADELIRRCMNGIDNDFIGIVNEMPTLEQEPCKETQMIDKSNFDKEQYKMDLQSAYDCGKASIEPCYDAISRQAALDIYDDYNVAVENGELEAYRKHRKRLLELPSTQPKTGWIPCSEKMPEKDTDILAYVEGVGVVYQRVMWVDDYTGEWVGFAGSGYRDDVIAWMPLPKPYKAEGSDKE